MTIKRTMRSLKDYSIYLLSKRDYGVKELERKLILKGYELGEIEQIIQYYLSIGYLNDEKLIVRVISYQISKDKNKKQIEMYLIGKGFDYQLIKSHLNEMNFKEIEEAIIEKQIIKYSKLTRPISDEKKINRLLNKGYSYESIKKVMDSQTE